MAFRNGLMTFLPKIKKVAYLTSVSILPGLDGTYTRSFVFKAEWEKPTKGEYCKKFTVATVFGRNLRSINPLPVKRPCDVRDEIIRDILNRRLRGVQDGQGKL